MKFFDLELNGLAATLGKASSGAVTSVSWKGTVEGESKCCIIQYTNGINEKSCMREEHPGKNTTVYR